MTSIAPIALFAPFVASNAVFSFRRASRGVDALDDNPFYAAMNMDIAAAQTLKGARAAKAIAIVSNPSFEETAKSAAETIKEVSKSNKVLKGLSKAVNFTADYINPVICVASGFKVLGADDKVDEGARESLRLGCMFGAESLTKEFIGMPVNKNIGGKLFGEEKNGFYKKVFNEKQINAVKDFCKTKNALKHAPAIAKGLLFVGASISGYKAGDAIAEKILGKQEESN